MQNISVKFWAGCLTARIKYARRDINNLRYAEDTTPIVKSEKELKSVFMKMKKEGKKLA